MEHSSRNGYLSLHHSIPFSVLILYPKSGIFACNLRVDLDRNNMVCTIRGRVMLPEALPPLLIHLRMVTNHFISNECLSSQYNIPFPLQRGQNLAFYIQFLESQCWQKEHSLWHNIIVDPISWFPNLPYASKEGYWIVQWQCIPLLVIYHPLSLVEILPQI